jgi:hypothetical protein
MLNGGIFYSSDNGETDLELFNLNYNSFTHVQIIGWMVSQIHLTQFSLDQDVNQLALGMGTLT